MVVGADRPGRLVPGGDRGGLAYRPATQAFRIFRPNPGLPQTGTWEYPQTKASRRGRTAGFVMTAGCGFLELSAGWRAPGPASGPQVPHRPHPPPQSRSPPGPARATAAATGTMRRCTGYHRHTFTW